MSNSNNGDPTTYNIIGACMKVHRQLGNGFLEKVYQEALEVELSYSQIPFSREVVLPITYRAQELNTRYTVDFICYGNILLELKAISSLSPIDSSQVLNYLNASGLEKALLINFGRSQLDYQRFNNSKNNQRKLEAQQNIDLHK